MAVIGLSGPHAIGKTTAVRRWLAKYPSMIGVIADDQWEATRDNQVRVREWKGTVGDKESLVIKHQKQSLVSVIDSVRTTNLNFFTAADPVIFVVCDWKTMERVLRDRCLRNEKEYNSKYWIQQKLEYECRLRYLNFARKQLGPKQYKVFEINNQSRDWPAVDEYFGQLYRRIHNRLVTQRRQGVI